MYRIIDGRGTGKTGRLLLLAKENNGIIVCRDPADMKQRAYAYGLTGIDFISYGEFSHLHRFNRPVYIDELDMFLKHINRDIDGYTVSEN